jgi:DNA-binding NarL/FixJ family response regulator
MSFSWMNNRRRQLSEKLCEPSPMLFEARSTRNRMSEVQRRIRVLCVNDNPMVVDAIVTSLRLSGGFDCVGQLLDAARVVEECRQLAPDVVLMDLDMPGVDPFEIMMKLAAQCPSSRILILSGHVRPDLLDRAIECGAWGYLSKNDDSETLISSIRRVAAGEFVLGQEIIPDSSKS